MAGLSKSSYHKFSLQDITKATNYFHKNKIYRDDKDWTEYLVNISSYDVKNNNKVKGKVIVRNFKEHTNAEFMKEVRTARRNELKPNQNLTPLLGYCTEVGKKILVYKYTEVAVAQPSHEPDLVIAPLPREFSYDDAILALSSSSFRQFSLGEIGSATSNFNSNSIFRSEPEFSVYVANITSYDFKLNVKHFHENTGYFEKEVAVLAFLEVHPNLISLIGYCIESNEKILVYKSPENGRLVDDYKDEKGCSVSFSWKMRLNICLGVAYGLQHLHKRTNKFPFGIVYRDMFLENILFDKNWAPTFSNFGGSEFGIDENCSKASDVQRFGRFLVSMLCKDSMQNLESCYENEENFHFAVWAQQNVDILIKYDMSDDSLKLFGDLIGKCCQEETLLLTTMDEVVLDLNAVLKCQNVTYGKPIQNVDLIKSPLRFRLDEIHEATNEFDMKKCIGKGGEGMVYLAELYIDNTSQTSQVAVKRINKGITVEFDKEIATVSRIQHPNVVSLLGYCRESEEKVLIYEYMGKGSLSDYVKKNSPSLSWKQRLKICLGAAYGLQHLHRPTMEFPKGIIHRDMKPENILIDNNWVAKVSDFGMLKLSKIDKSTIITYQAKGTAGYFAPETYSKSQLSRKIDVYAFGCVMFEVICRKKRWDAVDKSVYLDQNDNVGLLAYENVDLKIIDQISEESKVVFIDTIVASLQIDPKRRPTMDEVVHNLESALNYQEQAEEQKKIKASSYSDFVI